MCGCVRWLCVDPRLVDPNKVAHVLVQRLAPCVVVHMCSAWIRVGLIKTMLLVFFGKGLHLVWLCVCVCVPCVGPCRVDQNKVARVPRQRLAPCVVVHVCSVWVRVVLTKTRMRVFFGKGLHRV